MTRSRLAALGAGVACWVGVLALGAPAGAATKVQVHKKLLPPADLPAGWSAQPVLPKALATTCLRYLTAPVSHEVRATAGYSYGLSFESAYLQEGLATGANMTARFRQLRSELSHCTQGSVQFGGTLFVGNFGPASFVALGNRSSGYSLTLTSAAGTYRADALLFQVGSYVGDVMYIDLGTHDDGQLQTYATRAVTRL